MTHIKSLLLFLFSSCAMGAPWLTGPLLAPSGKTVPPHHVLFEPYFFYTEYPQEFKNFEVTPVLTAGITDFLDIQTSVPYDFSWERAAHTHNIGDYSLGFGTQWLRQQDHTLIPDLRIIVQEVFPTGKFDHLNPTKFGTDQTGSGAYQTLLSFNFQKTIEVQPSHYLRGRLSLAGSHSSAVTVDGINTFGGTNDTHGKIKPGRSYSVDVAFEYTLTQNWVPVFEALYVHSRTIDFLGNPGFTPGGSLADIGGPGGNSASLAPALEYNFNANIGLIGGVWFSVTGPRAAKFTAGTLALNCFF